MNLNRFFDDYRYAVSWLVAGLLLVSVLVSVFLITKTIVLVDQNRNTYAAKSIMIEGMGEVFAKPDIATFSFTIEETAKTVVEAQTNATVKNNSAMEFLKGKGVDDKDIKTVSYNVYPKYEWVKDNCLFDGPCSGGRSELTGYTVSQTNQVKVRDTQKSGDVLTGIGNIGIGNVSGLSFSIDDEDDLKMQAREQAIADAKNNAQKIANELGIKLGDVIGFNEDAGNYPQPMYYGGDMAGISMEKSSIAIPDISTGENNIKSHVYVTFKIQ